MMGDLRPAFAELEVLPSTAGRGHIQAGALDTETMVSIDLKIDGSNLQDDAEKCATRML